MYVCLYSVCIVESRVVYWRWPGIMNCKQVFCPFYTWWTIYRSFWPCCCCCIIKLWFSLYYMFHVPLHCICIPLGQIKQKLSWQHLLQCRPLPRKKTLVGVYTKTNDSCRVLLNGSWRMLDFWVNVVNITFWGIGQMNRRSLFWLSEEKKLSPRLSQKKIERHKDVKSTLLKIHV